MFSKNDEKNSNFKLSKLENFHFRKKFKFENPILKASNQMKEKKSILVTPHKRLHFDIDPVPRIPSSIRWHSSHCARAERSSIQGGHWNASCGGETLFFTRFLDHWTSHKLELCQLQWHWTLSYSYSCTSQKIVNAAILVHVMAHKTILVLYNHRMLLRQRCFSTIFFSIHSFFLLLSVLLLLCVCGINFPFS